MERIYNWVFWYNYYDSSWYGIHRDSQLQFFNGERQKSQYFVSVSLEKVIAKIQFYECNKSK
jgi:hypothetical protein